MLNSIITAFGLSPDPMRTLDQLIVLLQESNIKWQERVDKYGGESRPLLVMDPPDDIEFDIVLLHPNYFIVPNQHVSYYNRTGISPPDGRAYVAEKELVAGTPPQRFPPFRHNSRRAPSQTVNIFYLILNADAKFQYHKKYYSLNTISDRAKGLVDKTLQIVELIYFRPTLKSDNAGEVAAGNLPVSLISMGRSSITSLELLRRVKGETEGMVLAAMKKPVTLIMREM